MKGLEKLEKIVDEKNLNHILLAAPDNIEYFLGVRTIADSILLLHYEKSSTPRLYVPLLEYYRFRDLLRGKNIEVIAVTKTMKPADVKAVEKSWKEIINEITSKADKIGIDKSHPSPIRNLFIEIIKDKGVDISQEINKQRMIKEPWELEAIKKAISITAKGIKEVANNLRPSISEAELAGYFEHRVRMEGIDEYAFPPLILFKPGNSYPHNLPSNTRLGRKNLVLVDVGVKYNGRCSDLTRMILWGRPSKEEKKALEAVDEAVSEVIDKAEPGMTAEEIYMLAYRVLEKHRLAEKFIHGLGHGFGILVHEPPYISRGIKTKIEPGMAFTVEPGVYFAGRYGVRIEEDVLMTKKGLRVLSRRLERIIVP